MIQWSICIVKLLGRHIAYLITYRTTYVIENIIIRFVFEISGMNRTESFVNSIQVCQTHKISPNKPVVES